MNLEYTELIVPFVVAAVVQFVLLHVLWSHRKDPITRWFAATIVAMFIWAVGYCFELMSTDVDDMILFANIQYIGVTAVSVCWWETLRRQLRLGGVPRAISPILWTLVLATIVVAFWNPGGLFRGDPATIAGPSNVFMLDSDYGPWYWGVFIPLTALINIATLALLVRSFRKFKGVEQHQVVLLALAFILPVLSTVIFMTGVGGPTLQGHNLTPAVFGISALVLWMGLFRCRLLNILPCIHAQVINTLPYAVMVSDQDGQMAVLNPAAEQITGVKDKEAVGRPAAEVFAAYPAIVDLLSSSSEDLSHHVVGRDMAIKHANTTRHFSLASAVITSNRGDFMGTAMILHETTDRVRLYKEARRLANRDDLTGLPNRRFFFELTGKEFARAQRYEKPVAILMLDVDHFKSINDSYGHRVGDRVLRQVAQTCRKTLRTSDIMGRVGGEEFAILLPETDLGLAVEVAHRLVEQTRTIRLDLGESRAGTTGPTKVTISVGVAQLQNTPPGPFESFDSVFARADRALYQAKDAGRDTVVVSEEIMADSR